MNELQIINIETFKGLIGTAPEIITKGNDSIQKATARGEQLMQEITTMQQNDALWSDEYKDQKKKELIPLITQYLVKLKDTYRVLKERRTPITGLFDDFKKSTISFEAQVDPKGNNNLYSKFQTILDGWAKDEALKQAAKQAEMLRQKNIEAEKIRLKSECEIEIRKVFLAHLENEQNMLVKVFEGMILDKFDQQCEFIRNYSTVYFITHFEAIQPNLEATYLDQAEIKNIITNAKTGKFQIFSAEFKETIEGIKEMFIDKFASKKAELEELASATPAEKEEIKQNITERIETESEKIAKEKLEKEAQAVIQSTTNSQIMQANLAFDSESQVQQMQPEQKVKTGYEIKVLKASGWLQIAAFYFEKEGMKKNVADLGKMKLEQMKTFAEKHALKTGEKIENPFLVYEETFKAVIK
jgi:hypothetical protein